MKLTRLFECLLFTVTLSCTSYAGTSYYVATNAVPASPYSSWDTAFTNVQDALDVARNGDTIYLAGHAFVRTSQLVWSNLASSVTIRGGYAATNGADQPGLYNSQLWPTVVTNAGGSVRLLQINGVSNSWLEGVTFSGGSVSSNGGALYAVYCTNFTLAGCVLSNNRNSAAQGGGLYIGYSSGIVVSNSIIRNNTTGIGSFRIPGYGSGIYLGLGMGAVGIFNCAIQDNTANVREIGVYGSGIYVGSGAVSLYDSVLANNNVSGDHITYYGAIHNAGTLRLKNCLLKGNDNMIGTNGAVYAASGSLVVENCTLAYNHPLGIKRVGGTVAVTNSIFWNNLTDIAGSVALSWCNLQSGLSNGVNGNISADPLFEYGFRLGAGSPCVNKGTNSAAFWGLDGYTTRTDGSPDTGDVDLGYHYTHTGGVNLTYANLYVAEDGSDTGNSGTNAAQAFRTITKALSVAIDGSRIHVGAGNYTNGLETMPLAGIGIDGLQLLGAGSANTVINGLGAKQVMTLRNNSGHVRISDLTITGGTNGGGLSLVSCGDVEVESCVITNNRSSSDGGGLFVSRCGLVDVRSCLIANNQSTGAQGGGLYIDCSGGLTVSNSVVEKNTIGVSSFRIINYGGGIHLGLGMGTVEIFDSFIQNNTVNVRERGAYGSGVYIGSGTVGIYKSVLANNNVSGDHITDYGAVYNAGSLRLRNCLLKGNSAGGTNGAVYAASGALVVDNCTLAYNPPLGIFCAGGTISATNSIFWGNTVDIGGNGGSLELAYCNLQSGMNNGVNGNKSFDPLFADTNYFHLQSKGGYYTNGFFSGGDWLMGSTSASNSPVIDAGDPATDYADEPAPNGERVNMGVYGNTAVASLTDTTTQFNMPDVANLGATLAGHRTARLNGQVTDTGGQIPLCGFEYWIASTGLTSTVPVGVENGVFFVDVAGLTPGNTYEFIAFASNSAGQARSDIKEFSMHPAADGLYVATNGDDTAGASWSSAYTNLQTALTLAEAGDTVYVAGQTFAKAQVPLQPSLFTWQTISNVTIRGGYAAANNNVLPGTNNPALWPTVVVRSGGVTRLLQMTGVTNGWIEGMVFAGGSGSENGGGLYIAHCSNITLSGCVISNNQSTAFLGGGIYITNSTMMTFSNSVIRNNTIGVGSFRAASYGGGIYLGLGMGTVQVFNSFIQNNTANVREIGAYGSGIYIGSGTIDIYKSVLANNNSSGDHIIYYGALYNAGTLRLRNCLLYGNSASGAVYNAGGSLAVESCTLAYNPPVAITRAGGTVTVTNSVLWGNEADILGTMAVGYSALSADQLSVTNGMNGCITGDPLFVNVSIGDYRLEKNSPCINAGTIQEWMSTDTDIADTKRVMNGKVDMGAYESSYQSGTVFVIY